MATQRSCKVFVRFPEGVCDLFWVNVTKDASVILGTSYRGTETVHVVIEEGAARRQGDFLSEDGVQNAKITFHYSGYYKMSARIGQEPESMDRCTVKGVPLSEINEPRRMADVILPNSLKVTDRELTDLDIVLDATSFPSVPLRCTVWCCALSTFHNFAETPAPVVDTSLVEYSRAFEDGERAWAFTLRASREDESPSEGFYFHIPGTVQWGTPQKDV